MKTTINDIKISTPYCLHDAVLYNMKKDDDKLTLEFDSGTPKDFYYNGEIEFSGVDWYFVQFMVASYNGRKGFTGWEASFEDFNKMLNDYHLTIMDEYYGFNTVILEGFIACEQSYYDCRLRIHYKEMKYITEE